MVRHFIVSDPLKENITQKSVKPHEMYIGTRKEKQARKSQPPEVLGKRKYDNMVHHFYSYSLFGLLYWRTPNFYIIFLIITKIMIDIGVKCRFRTEVSVVPRRGAIHLRHIRMLVIMYCVLGVTYSDTRLSSPYCL